MLRPERRRRRDYKFCFFGREFEKRSGDPLEAEKAVMYEQVIQFLSANDMKAYPLVEPGKWLWPGLMEGIRRSAFCVFEVCSKNPNAHIELGIALAQNQQVALLISEKDESQAALPVDLAGLIQVRYSKAEKIADQLDKLIPKEWYSVERRLDGLLRVATRLDRFYLEQLLRLDFKKSLLLAYLVGLGEQQHGYGSSNMAVAEFLFRYDELLQVDGSVPSDDLPFSPPTPPEFDKQRINLDPNYRDFVATRLGLRL